MPNRGSAVQPVSDLGDHRVWSPREVVPGEAQHPPALIDQRVLPRPVALKPVGIRVKRLTIHLYGQLLPQEMRSATGSLHSIRRAPTTDPRFAKQPDEQSLSVRSGSVRRHHEQLTRRARAVAAEVAPVDEPAGRSLSPSQEASPPARATTRLTVRPQPHPYPYPPSRRQCADGRGPRTPGRR